MRPLIHFDQSNFKPFHICPVTHDLSDHPLLQLSEIIKLSQRLKTFRFHDDQARAGTDFTNAPQSNPVDKDPRELLKDIENAKAWIALHNVQQDDIYRGLIDEVLDSVRPTLDPVDPGMYSRAGWIFVTSPGAVTPYHMDHEHNFILQIKGTKEIHVFPTLNRSIVSERCLEIFHHNWSRELVTYSPEFEKDASVFNAGPGMGAYMPQTSPHWVKNGEEVSITISFTYYTKATQVRAAAHKTNYKLRRLGMSPSPVGNNLLLDRVKAASIETMSLGKDVISFFMKRQHIHERRPAYARS